jgi:hypothetical protein
MDTQHFAQASVGGLEVVCYSEGENLLERKIIVHFDSAMIYNTKIVMDQLQHSELNKMEHPSYSPDLAPCDLLPLSSMYDEASVYMP